MPSDPSPQPAPTPAARGPVLLTLRQLLPALLLAGLFIALHFNFLHRMFRVATDRWGGDWSHALAIPFLSAFYIHRQRHALARLPITAGWLGLPILLAGILAYAIAIHPGRNDMLQGYAMIVALFGLLWLVLGPAPMRILWFPVAFLALGVKVSDRLWEQLAWKLQLLAAQAATVALNLLGLDAHVQGSTIDLYEGAQALGKINVAEACSGLRMLMAFISLGVAIAFFGERRPWQRLVLVLSTVPIALLVNIGRVTLMGLVYRHDPQLTTGALHQFIGLIMLVPALVLFVALGWVLDHLLIRVPESQPGAAHPSPSLPAAPAEAQAVGAAGAGVPGNPGTGRTDSHLDGSERSPRRGRSEGPDSFHAVVTSPVCITSRQALAAMLAGAAMTALLGLAYVLFLASRSTAVFNDRLPRPIAAALMCASLAGAMVIAWAAYRRIGAAHAAPLPHRGMTTPGAATPMAQALAVGVLLVSVIGLNAVVSASGAALRKLPVPVRKPLFAIPDRLGHWHKLHDDPALTPEMLESLGTTQYLSRAYRDETWPQPTGAIAKLHIAYYTGTPDTVPHVPERCFVAAGMQHLGKKTIAVPLPRSHAPSVPPAAATTRPSDSDFGLRTSDFPPTLPLTVFTFAAPDRPRVQANVAYFFIANGRFLPSPDHVRLSGFNLTDRYAYYCKVEVGLFDVGDPDLAAARAADLLAAALPHIMLCLPDWNEVQQGRWPPK